MEQAVSLYGFLHVLGDPANVLVYFNSPHKHTNTLLSANTLEVHPRMSKFMIAAIVLTTALVAVFRLIFNASNYDLVVFGLGSVICAVWADTDRRIDELVQQVSQLKKEIARLHT